MNPKRLHRRWKASLAAKHEAIRTLLRSRRPLSEPEVHDLRVALRRARLLADLGARTLGKTWARRFREVTRDQLDALDPLRDCDVALAWLREAGTSEATVKKLRQRRTRLWLTAKRRLKPNTLGSGAIASGEKSEPKKLLARLEKHLTRVTKRAQKTVRRAPELPVEELHALRRVVRRWRYLRELQLGPREIRHDRRLKTLIQVQGALGALQNDDVILNQLRSLGRTTELQQLRAALRSQFTHHHREALRQIKELPVLS